MGNIYRLITSHLTFKEPINTQYFYDLNKNIYLEFYFIINKYNIYILLC